MNEFVEECRGEWKRLRVPDPVANEMAAELAADLEEAEAEGVSAEEVLGSGAFDPRSFATAWAAERGLIQRPLPSGRGLLGRSRLPAAIGALFMLISIVGAVLVILDAPSGPRRLALPPPPDLAGGPGMRPGVRVLVRGDAVRIAPPPSATPEAVWTVVAPGLDDSGDDDARTVGAVLLIVGLAGVVPLTLFSLWVGPGGWPRRGRHIDERPSGPAY